jgi:ABC-type Na+ efflux pump permease subunit
MPEEKKTEEQLRQEIIEEYFFDEDDERIDKILEIKKDRYTATQAKKKAREEAEQLKQRKEHYKKLATQTGDNKSQKGDEVELSIKDSARLQQANIPVDDWDEVVSYAKFKGVAITDALNSSVVKATLKERQEERQSASAANSGATRRGTSKISGEKLLEEAESKGKLPETDEEMRALAEARYNRA